MPDRRKKLYEFSENIEVTVCAVCAEPARTQLYESFGILKGAHLRVFLVSGKRVILIVGRTKLALSSPATEEILCE